MRNPYEILGVAPNAAAADVKKAYRRLAKKFHPDQSKEANAKEKFAEANSAYEIVGDEKKRAAFDRGEIDAEGKPKFQGFEHAARGAGPRGSRNGQAFEFNFGGAPFGGGGAGGFDPSDIFSDLFSGGGGARRGPGRGEDVVGDAAVRLEDVAKGSTIRLDLPSGRRIEANVPPGMEDGKQIRLKGQGMPGPAGGTAGDLLITVRYAPHKYFTVQGSDVRLDLPLRLDEAVLGATVRAPTLSGAVDLTIPPNTSSGRVLRLRGRGLPGANGTTGDLLVNLRIVLPEKVDPALTELMRGWSADPSFDPRKGMVGG